jgi:hypothetical protein
VIQVFAHISSAPNWKAVFYDATPRWVYDTIDSQNPGNPRPIVAGRKVGHKLDGCGNVAVLPMYDSPTWREAYFDLVRAFGERYGDHPQVAATVINTGLDGETQAVKDWYCDWNAQLDKQAPDVRYRFGQFMLDTMDVYREAFPNKHIFINNAPGGSGTRLSTAEHAASLDPPVGLKHSGMWIDLDSHQGYGDFVGSWDMIREYSMTLPIWLESPFGLGGSEHRYWALMAGLHYHPDAMNLHPEFFPQSEPEWLRFAVEHIGVTITDTPSVWTVLRDAEYPLVSWGEGGVSGFMGDWTFWLYRLEDAPQSATERVWRDDMPAAKDHVFSRQARRTKQSANHIYMSFDIDDDYPYIAQKPSSLPGGNVSYYVEVTVLNHGNDTFALQYRNWDGGIISQVRRKGPSLGPVDDWVTVVFEVDDGYLDNNMPGGADFRISCERDGDVFIHKVVAKGIWGAPPEATATPRPSPTVRPSATSPPTATPLVSPVPVPPHNPDAALFHPADDTFLDAWAPNATQNTSVYLSARQGNIRVPLLRFDLRAIPPNAQITSAKLHLYAKQRSNEAYMTISAHKMLRPWDGRYATWGQAARNAQWALAGCADPLQDLSHVSLDSVDMRHVARWYELDVTALVREWVDQPVTNYGLAIRSSSSASVQYDFYSSAFAEAAMRPRLEVVWSPGPTATPSPSQQPPSGFTPAPSVTPTLSPTPTAPPVPTGSPFPTATPSVTPTSSPSAIPTASPSAAPLPGPTTAVFRQGDGYMGATDTFLDAWAPDTNHDHAIKLGVRQGSVRVPLMRFALDTIPAHSSIRRALLRVYVTDAGDSARLDLSIFKVTRPWDHKLVTWNRATATEAWGQPGALDVERDRSSRVYAHAVSKAERNWIEFDVTALVQEWVSAPQANYGLLIAGEGSVSMQVNLASSSWAVIDFRPHLEVEYVPLAPTPTPRATNTLVPPTPDSPTLTPTASPTLLPVSGEITFQEGVDGYQGCTDTFVDRWYPTMNYATKDRLVVRQGDNRSTLIRYDLRALPPTSNVISAQLHLYVQYRSGPHPLPVKIYGIARPWTIDKVTYQRASRARAWNVEGINGLGSDLVAPPLDERTLNAQGRWITFDVTRMAQTWVKNPEYNHGLVIKANGGTAVEYQFASSDWQTASGLRPRLVISWEGGVTATPPASATATPDVPATLPPIPTPSAPATLLPTFTPTAELLPATATPAPQRLVLTLQQGQDGYRGTTDTFLDGWSQGAVRGGAATFTVRQGNVRVGLVRFDLDRIPDDASIIEATLKLWTANASNQGQAHLRAFRLLCPWQENQANWLMASQAQAWAAPGAGDAGQDYDGTVVGQAPVWGSRNWVEVDVTSALRHWMAHPDENYGLLLRSEGGVSVEHQFASAQWLEAPQRPKLAIVYESGRITTGAPGDISILRWLVVAGAVIALVVLLVAGRRPRKPEEEVDSVT